MPYASVNIFALKPGTMESFIALQRTTFLDLLRQQAGFLGLEIVQTGESSGVATLIWASAEARQQATPALTPWVEEHLDPFFDSLDNPAGEVLLSWRTESTQVPQE